MGTKKKTQDTKATQDTKEAKDTKATKKKTTKKKEEPKVKQQGFQHEGSMAQFVDEFLKEGTEWETLLKKCQKEAERRGIKSLKTPGSIKGHIRYRRKKGMEFPQYAIEKQKA